MINLKITHIFLLWVFVVYNSKSQYPEDLINTMKKNIESWDPVQVVRMIQKSQLLIWDPANSI